MDDRPDVGLDAVGPGDAEVDPVAGAHTLGLAAGDPVDIEAVGVRAVVVGEQPPDVDEVAARTDRHLGAVDRVDPLDAHVKLLRAHHRHADPEQRLAVRGDDVGEGVDAAGVLGGPARLGPGDPLALAHVEALDVVAAEHRDNRVRREGLGLRARPPSATRRSRAAPGRCCSCPCGARCSRARLRRPFSR
jgi:hypothetical protein